MTTTFQPLGEQARWKIIYELLQAADVGSIINYTDMGNALDLDPDEDRHAIQMAFRKAAREYLIRDDRATESVPNVGYRVVEPSEHLGLARKQQTRASKSLKQGHRQVVHVDLNGMDPEIRKAFDVTARAFSTLLDFNRRLDMKQRNLEDALGTIVVRQDRSEDELVALKARLASLEEARKGSH